MTDEHERPAVQSDLAQAHVQELIAKGKAHYLVFELIDALDADEPDSESIREAVVGVVEANAREELKQGREIRETARTLLARDGRAKLVQAWRTCLDAAAPDRKAMKSICADFAAIVDEVSAEALLESLDFVGEVLSHHGRQGVAMLCEGLGERLRSLPADKRAAFIEWLTPYAPCAYDKPFAGLTRIVAVLVDNDDTDLLGKLKEALPTEVFEEEVPPDKFAIHCGAGIDAVPESLRYPYVRLACTMALTCCSSAASVSAKLPKKLAEVRADAQAEYLDSVARLIEAAGVRVAGFCLSRLHPLFAQPLSPQVQQYIDAVCGIADRYGSTAAVAFMERRTAAGRDAWPGG